MKIIIPMAGRGSRLRPQTLIIHDNLKKRIFYIINIFKDKKITNYSKKYLEIKTELFNLLDQSSRKCVNKSKSLKIDNIKVKSNTSKKKFLKIVDKAKN